MQFFKELTEDQRRIIKRDQENMIDSLLDIVEDLRAAKSDQEILQALNNVRFHGDQVSRIFQSLNIQFI